MRPGDTTLSPAIVGGHWYLLTRGHCCCCCCSGHDLCRTRLGFVTLCRMCSQLDRAAASWSWFPPALLGCLASGAAVCPLSIWWRIYLWSSCEAHLRWRWWRSSGCVRAVEGESGLELPSPDCRLQLRAGLGWAGLGWAGLVRMWGHHQSCSLHTTRCCCTTLYSMDTCRGFTVRNVGLLGPGSHHTPTISSMILIIYMLRYMHMLGRL